MYEMKSLFSKNHPISIKYIEREIFVAIYLKIVTTFIKINDTHYFFSCTQ